jgi:predicted PurR-regulated permease PerM
MRSAHVPHRADELDGSRERFIRIPLSTIVKVLLVVVAIWSIYKLATVIALVLVAVVLAISLEPIVAWLERHGLARWVASTLVVFSLAGVLILFFAVCGSSLAVQGRQVTGRLSTAQEDLAAHVPPPFDRMIRESKTPTPDASSIAGYAVRLGSILTDVVLGAAIAFILTVYLLIEGRRTWAWLVAYAPRHNRARVQETANAACNAVLHYVAGNIATSVFAGVTVLIVLSILHVPAALLLALLAGVCDFVPVLGFIVSALPAVLLALTVSPTTAVIVAVAYIAYHMAENYFIGPRVYGGQLRLSNLAVLIAFAIGAELFGIIGALLALPVAAMYPCVEDVWLRDYLGRDAVETHRKIEHQSRDT